MNKKRYTEIDICRGIGIMLVVLGHALKQTGESNMLFAILISVIYSFHMPLFFFASGFTAIRILDLTTVKEKKQYIKNRAIRLLIPYFAVGLFYMPIKYVLSKYAVRPYDFSNAWKLLIGDNPNTVLWFIYTLFIVSVICTLLLTRKNLKIVLLISAIISLVSWTVFTDINTLKFFFFFVAGIYLRLNYDEILLKLKGGSIVISTVLFILFNAILFLTDITGCTFITAITGSICTLYLSSKINTSSGMINKASLICGKYSMDIYILSDLIATAIRILLWGILSLHYIPCTILCFLTSILLPIPISKYIVRRVKILKLLILGEK